MVKRPSYQLDPELVDRAIGLRRRGLTIREIAAETGASKSAIQVALAEAEKAGRLARGAPGMAPENVDLADDLDDESRGWLRLPGADRARAQSREGSATRRARAGRARDRWDHRERLGREPGALRRAPEQARQRRDALRAALAVAAEKAEASAAPRIDVDAAVEERRARAASARRSRAGAPPRSSLSGKI